MRAEIISVGTELLMGQILDTNSQYISRQLTAVGVNVYYKSTVGDNPKRMEEALSKALSRSDVLIATGGLGPTQDDITKETLAELMGCTLELHQPSLDAMKHRYRSFDQPMAPNNIKQVMMPKGSIILPNHHGSAPGCIIEKEGKCAIILPGPPREMMPMFDQYVMPYLQEKSDAKMVSHYLRVIGVGESSVAHILKDLIDTQTNPTIAMYAGRGDVELRITASGKEGEDLEKVIEPVETQIIDILGESIYSYSEDTMEMVVADALQKKGLTVSVAESCTGGLLASSLISVAGSSQYFKQGIVSYSNESKINLLNVPEDIIKQHGAVSPECAIAMAEGIRKLSNTDYGISTTGIAGPEGGSEEKPVGTVYIAVSSKEGTTVEHFVFYTERNETRYRATINALNILRKDML